MITVIETNDGRLMITNAKDVKKVISQAISDKVDFGCESVEEIINDNSFKIKWPYFFIENGRLKINQY